MNFTEAVKSAYRNYVTFSGRAARSEYWWYTLFLVIGSVVLALVESALGFGSGAVQAVEGGVSASYAGGPLSIIWSPGNLLPALAVGVRRLHDTDRSGWWYLIALVPLVGFIVLLVFFCTKGSAGNNRFGADPLGSPASVF
ncbi:DUF805 domain-containing protein [Rhodobacter sp.]